ncbi:MAG: hypothetical protein QOE33_472 [Acidobacteriota bacterium]|nr:hypothetical protein [Acidobacteriota bacterium]
MLTIYVDETGHSKDQGQKFVGVAGVIAPAANWERFESKWKGILAEFKLPYFHMREFAHSEGLFRSWKGKEQKRRKLFGKLMKAIETAYPIPFGSVMPLDAFRRLTDSQKVLFSDPYFLCLQNCIKGVGRIIQMFPEEEEVALVLSEQGEFKRQAIEMCDFMRANYSYAQKLTFPVFRDMRKIVPLQAADVVAYEFQKEYERMLYRPTSEPRFGYKVLEAALGRHRLPQGFCMLQLHDADSVMQYVRAIEQWRGLAETEAKKQA